jgi:transcriptional regulator with XRE-family HTH domain
MRRRKKRSRAEWTRLVTEWQAGDLSQQAFAKRKGIAPTTLSWWACRLRREAQEQGALVPVDVVADAPAGGEFRVEVASGRTVFVPASFDAAALRRLVAVLEGGAC